MELTLVGGFVIAIGVLFSITSHERLVQSIVFFCCLMRRIAERRAEVLPWKLKKPLFGQIWKGQIHGAETLVPPTRSLVGIKQYLKSQLHDFFSLCLMVLMRILKPRPTALKTRTKLLASHHIKVLEAHRSAVTLILGTCRLQNGSCAIARRHFQSVYRSHNVPPRSIVNDC